MTSSLTRTNWHRTGRVLQSFIGLRSQARISTYCPSWGRSFSAQAAPKMAKASTSQVSPEAGSPTPTPKVAKRMDGKRVADEILSELRTETIKLQKEFNEIPGLAVIQVGGRPDSSKYVQMKRKIMADIGFADFGCNLPDQVNQEAVLNVIDHLNKNPKVHGVLVQLPLPDHIDSNIVTSSIRPRKDVDGFHPNNVGLLTLKQVRTLSPWSATAGNYSKQIGIEPCTPKGCIELLDRYGIQISGKHAVVLGRSNIVGHPLATLLLHRDATVTICHSRTKNIAEITRQADIVVAAIGIPRFVKKDWVKPGAVVIDVGVNFAPDPKRGNKVRMCGDVDYSEVRKVASLITPVPGGVGPMTVAMLMKNTLENAKSYWNKYYRAPWFMQK